jgi:hypothetical protein
LIDGRKKEGIMDVCNNFERMEVNKDSVGSMKSFLKIHKPSQV